MAGLHGGIHAGKGGDMEHFEFCVGAMSWHGSLMDWLIFVAYLAAAFLCLRSAMQGRGRGGLRAVILWYLFMVFLLALALERQFGILSALASMGGRVAKGFDWSRLWGPIHEGLGQWLPMVAAALILIILLIFRRSLKTAWLGLAGVACLVAFMLLRANFFPALHKARAGGVQLYQALELAGVFCVGMSAAFTISGPSSRARGASSGSEAQRRKKARKGKE